MREFKGAWNNKEINEHLKLVENLMSKHKLVLNQVEEFKRITKKSRRIFFRYKLFLMGKIDTIGEKNKKICWSGCYFCHKDRGLLIHHINFNRKDDRMDNLCVLCSSCHTRLHRIFTRYFKEYQSRNKIPYKDCCLNNKKEQ